MNASTGALRVARVGDRSIEPAVRSFKSDAADCVNCPIRRMSLCASLDDEGLEALHAIRVRRRIERGQTLAWSGQESSLCANLLSGMLKVTASSADGRDQVVGLLYPGDFVGRPYAERTDFTITALSDAELCSFSRRAFERLLQDNPRLEHELLRRTLASLDAARSQIFMIARQSAGGRVASFLLASADRLGGVSAFPGGEMTFELPLSRGAIGDVLGLTIETVSRQMTKLKTAGVIGLPGGRMVTVRRRSELAALAAAA